MKPYVIVSPPYDHTSGGIKVMYGLYGHLLARGYEVYMNQYPAGNVIAIYPEIAHGNPVGAKTVVRYILNKPGVMMSNGVPGPTEFGENDRLYYFSRFFGGNGTNTMFLPVINTDIFRKLPGKVRNKRAIFVGKGVDMGLHKPGAIIIDRSLARDQEGLAELLNECEVLYSYDPVSAMTECSRLCGCRVVYLSDVYTRKDYEKYEPGTNGMSFGEDTGEALNYDEFKGTYESLKDKFNDSLTLFIEGTQR